MRNRGIIFALLLSMSLASGSAGQKKTTPWTEWSAKNAQKILDESGWSHTQSETDLNKPNPYSPRLSQVGIIAQNARTNYRIRFISAKPVRQAFYRLLQLDRKGVAPNLLKQAFDFIEEKFDQAIVVAVDYDCTEQRLVGPAFRAFNSVITSILASNTYLEAGGKRSFLQEYRPPDPNRIGGAWFIFQRTVDGEPFLHEKLREVRFHSEFPQLAGNDAVIKLDWRFNIAEFLYDGVPEIKSFAGRKDTIATRRRAGRREAPAMSRCAREGVGVRAKNSRSEGPAQSSCAAPSAPNSEPSLSRLDGRAYLLPPLRGSFLQRL
jgi:hypothetical protein